MCVYMCVCVCVCVCPARLWLIRLRILFSPCCVLLQKADVWQWLHQPQLLIAAASCCVCVCVCVCTRVVCVCVCAHVLCVCVLKCWLEGAHQFLKHILNFIYFFIPLLTVWQRFSPRAGWGGRSIPPPQKKSGVFSGRGRRADDERSLLKKRREWKLWEWHKTQQLSTFNSMNSSFILRLPCVNNIV